MNDASVSALKPDPLTVIVSPGSASLTLRLNSAVESPAPSCAWAGPGKADSAAITATTPMTTITIKGLRLIIMCSFIAILAYL